MRKVNLKYSNSPFLVFMYKFTAIKKEPFRYLFYNFTSKTKGNLIDEK